MTERRFSNGYSLLIGTGGSLKITTDDAVALYRVLTDPLRAAYPLEHVELLIEEAANRQNIIEAFDRLIERANQNPEATVIVYFSGHGGRIVYNDAPNEYYLIPYGYNPAQRATTAISGIEFTEKIELLKAKKLVVFLDCCHAGGLPQLKDPGEIFIKAPLPLGLLSVLDKGTGSVVVASSHEGEYSYTGHPYSIFTTCLLEALEGKASINKDGFARILDILIYLFKNVPERAPGPQHPFVKKVLDLGDNFPLCFHPGAFDPTHQASLDTVTFSKDTTAFLHSRRRMLKKRASLQEEWELRTEKARRIRARLAIETDVEVEFKLEKQLLEEEADIAQLSDRLDRLEMELSQ